jgi:lactoylglutathione lyase
MFSELFPIVATTDMARALSFYRDQLGGIVTFEYPGPDGKPVYVGLDIGATHLGIGLTPGVTGGPLPRPLCLWVYAENCDAAVERLRAAGTRVTEEPVDQPWGERVARVVDPDGNEIIIGQRASPPAPPDIRISES